MRSPSLFHIQAIVHLGNHNYDMSMSLFLTAFNYHADKN